MDFVTNMARCLEDCSVFLLYHLLFMVENIFYLFKRSILKLKLPILHSPPASPFYFYFSFFFCAKKLPRMVYYIRLILFFIVYFVCGEFLAVTNRVEFDPFWPFDIGVITLWLKLTIFRENFAFFSNRNFFKN